MFAAERKLRSLKADRIAAPHDIELSDLVRLLVSIQNDVQELKGAQSPVQSQMAPVAYQADDFDVLAEKERHQRELTMIRTEMRALAVCIEHTKAEIASLRPTGTEEDRLLVVANELDAIVHSTEQATQSILEAAEKLDGFSQQLQANPDVDPFVKTVADEIGETIITIYEACNFQDITGQRISKVVRTLEFVEQRVMAMISIWGDDAIAEVQPKANTAHANEEAKLLNGPQLAAQAITQDEIDKLFG